MIDISKCEVSEISTNVQPSDRIFKELGKNTYDYVDLVSELIDNAIAARRPDRRLKVVVDVFIDRNGSPVRFVITDNAAGIPRDELGEAISPAAVLTRDSLNEHGLGMKQAVAALGTLDYLATKTDGEGRARLIREFRFGDIETFYVPFPQDSGTQISVVDLNPIVIATPQSITKTVEPYLGARYRRFLRAENKEMDLAINIRYVEPPDEVVYSWDIAAVRPIYFHPSTRDNQPVIYRYELGTDRWKAELTFGYAPSKDGQYEELGLELPKSYDPYRVSQPKQGIDVIAHKRVILFHQLSELGIVPKTHPDFNTIRGEIDLIGGFSTAITKNSMIQDANFRECIGQVKAILNGEAAGPDRKPKNYLKRKTYPEEIPEKLLRDRLVEWLQRNPLQKRDEVDIEYTVEGIAGKIDIMADGEAWELKCDQASSLDVYQLFMYMDVADISKGFLVAGDFAPSAEVAVRHIQRKHGKQIALARLSDFPINHHPSDEEREQYY